LLKATVTQETLKSIDETNVVIGSCGDGKREGSEECDDGNKDANDGCQGTCKVEGGFQCLPLEVNGKDMCVACADNQCTTTFSLQSRCLDTDQPGNQDNGQSTEHTSVDSENPPVDALKNMKLVFDSFLQERESHSDGDDSGAYQRGSNGFCECGPNFCKLNTDEKVPIPSFVCKSTAKGWARASLTDESCTCAPGFCSMKLAQVTPTQFHCTPLHQNMIREEASGKCTCRGAVEAVESSDPSTAVKARTAACKILPIKPVEAVPGGQDRFGEFECVGEPYVKAAGSDQCEKCSSSTTKPSCKMDRSIGTGNFLCFDVTAGSSSTATAPYSRKSDGKCECGADQCLFPNGDHEVCRGLANSHPYGPSKFSNGKCGCSADANVCRLDITGGFRCVHISEDNFARNYKRSPTGTCQCKENMCIGSPHEDNGALQCQDASIEAPYQQKMGTFECECKPGSCKFPNGVCKTCPDMPGHCESMCHESSSKTEIECVKFCRMKTIKKQMVRATAQGQLQSVKKVIAREIGCFVQKVTTCSITANSKSCTQVKSAKALYNCPAQTSGSEPLRLRDGTETFGYTSMCDRADLECMIQNCGRLPDSNLCQSALLLV